MARLDRARLDAMAHPVRAQLETRFSDLDVQNHVNNAAAVALLQEGRVRFNTVRQMKPLFAGTRLLVASVQVEFARELHYPEPVEIGTGVLSVGRTSFVMGQVIRQGGVSAIYAETILVVGDANGPITIPDALRDALNRAV